MRQYSEMINELSGGDDNTSNGEKRNRVKHKPPKKETIDKEKHIEETYKRYNSHQVDDMYLVEELSKYTLSTKICLRKYN